jgi:hypothetical protein
LRKAHHHAREIIAAARAGAAVPLLEATAHARAVVGEYLRRFEKPVVTMTLRNTYDAARNADVGRWESVRELLRHRCDVIGIADTAQALRSGIGYAELDLDLRLALYQGAAMNLHCHGGPAELCKFSDAPYVMFDAASPAADWQKHWEWLGLKRGDQMPWAGANQRLVYGPVNVQDAVDALDVSLAGA